MLLSVAKLLGQTGAFLQWLVLILCLSQKLPKRKGFLGRLAGMVALSFFVEITAGDRHFSMPETSIHMLIITLLSVALLFVCYRITIWESIFIYAASFSFQYLTFSSIYFIQLTCGVFMADNMASACIHCFVTVISYLLALRFLTPRVTKYRMENKRNRPLTALAIIAIAIDELLNYTMLSNDPALLTDPVIFFCWRGATALCYVLLLCLMFNLLEIEQMQKDRSRQIQMLDAQEKQFKLSCAAIEQMNIYAHDLRHQLQLIQESGGKLSDEMIQKMTENVNRYDAQINTGCKVLDTVLTQHQILCLQKGISFSCIADGSGLTHMDPVALFSLFSNLIGNAVEAVEDLPANRRIITLSVRIQNGFTCIHAENYFSGQIKKEGSRIVTQKGSKEEHGFGLISIRMIVDEYNGDMTITPQNDVFSINILLPCVS